MNNKQLGTEFENEMCKELSEAGYWVHFVTPDKRGAQPFDIIAVKHNLPFAIDCKTSVKRIFSIERLEDNQILAFEKWERCGNRNAFIAIKYKEQILLLQYHQLKAMGKVDLEAYDGIYRWK